MYLWEGRRRHRYRRLVFAWELQRICSAYNMGRHVAVGARVPCTIVVPQALTYPNGLPVRCWRLAQCETDT